MIDNNTMSRRAGEEIYESLSNRFLMEVEDGAALLVYSGNCFEMLDDMLSGLIA
jgi:hypothetical protein